MDNQTLFDVKNAVEVMSKALKLFAEKITELMNWYHINQDTINEYLKAFGNLILWRNAVNRYQRQLYAGHLHPCDHRYAEKRFSYRGELYG